MKRQLCVCLMFLLPALAQAGGNMKAFAPAAPGMTRHVLELPAADNEADLRVELMVGQVLELDERNHYFLAGRIEAVPIHGWGFTFYQVTDIGPLAGTLMAVDPGLPKTRRFIRLGGEPYLIRYNSRLPVVVHVPRDAEVRYRVWRADPRPLAMPPG